MLVWASLAPGFNLQIKSTVKLSFRASGRAGHLPSEGPVPLGTPAGLNQGKDTFF